MDFATRMRNLFTEKARTVFYLTLSAIATLLVALLYFVPFCLHTIDTSTELVEMMYFQGLTPSGAIALLSDTVAVETGMSTIGIIVFALYMVMLFLSVIFFIKAIFSIRRGAEKVRKDSFIILILSTAFTGGYAFLGFMFDLINRASGGVSKPAFNLWPFIIVVVIDLVFAVVCGILKESKDNSETQKKQNAPQRKKLFLYKLELFAYVTGAFVFGLISFLTNILTVKSTTGDVYDLKLNGIEILENVSTAQTSGQMLAFLIFVFIVLISVFYLLSLLGLLSKSRAYFKIAVISTVLSCASSFLIGMYGKYYEIIQATNLETFETWLKNAGLLISTSSLKLENVEIVSNSLYFFIVSLVFAGALLLRRPYSKGLAVQNKLEPEENVLVANFENGGFGNGNGYGYGKTNEKGDIEEEQVAEQTMPTDVAFADPCPTFTELDREEKSLKAEAERKLSEAKFENLSLPSLVEFIVQYARDSRLHLFYTNEDIATFIAGLGTTKLSILQGMSGTGKTSLPKIFSEAIYSNCEIVEVESSWRDKNELLGYYNEFSKAYTPKKFTEALYRACLNPKTITFIVLDEMNLSRIEYYFSDFLSLMENEPDKREIKLLNVALKRVYEGKTVNYKALKNGHTLKVLPNVWFIGTANRDESTYEISDKVYDRAHTMNFNKRAKSVRHYNEELSPRFVSVDEFNGLIEKAKSASTFSIDSYPVIAEVEKILEPYNISFGNRIARQIESFVAVYCACFASSEAVVSDAVERILLSKVVAKLELKSIDDKAELASQFEELGLKRCSEFISKLNED